MPARKVSRVSDFFWLKIASTLQTFPPECVSSLQVGEGRALYNLGNVYHAQGKHLGRIGPQEPGGFSDEVKHCLQKAVEYYA